MTAVGHAAEQRAGATKPDIAVAANLKGLGYGG